MVTAECLFDEGWNAGKQSVEAPVVAEVCYHDAPHVGRGEYVVPWSANLHGMSIHMHWRVDHMMLLSIYV